MSLETWMAFALASMVLLATVNAALHAMFAAAARRALAAPTALRRFNVAGGLLLTGAGVWALFARRAAPGA
jgi:threonine/homoserine/homoserine lactone efflux protein